MNSGKPLLQLAPKVRMNNSEPRCQSLILFNLSIKEHANASTVSDFHFRKLALSLEIAVQHLSCIKNEWGHLDKKFKGSLLPVHLMFSLRPFFVVPSKHAVFWCQNKEEINNVRKDTTNSEFCINVSFSCEYTFTTYGVWIYLGNECVSGLSKRDLTLLKVSNHAKEAII